MKQLGRLSLILLLALQASCGAGASDGAAKAGPETNVNHAQGEPQPEGKQAALDEEFQLLPHEKIAIKETGLVVQLDKVLRSWYTNGKSETVSVEVTTTLNGTAEKQYMDFKKGTVAIGEFNLELLAANPFGKNECKFKVTRRKP